MPELGALPGDITIQPSLPAKSVSIAASDGTGAGDGGSLSLVGGNDAMSGGSVTLGGGQGTGEASNGGNATLTSGGSDVAGGSSITALGSSEGNGGDLRIVPGTVVSGPGRNGVIKLLGAGANPLPTSDPMVVDAIWNSGGFVKVSAAT